MREGWQVELVKSTFDCLAMVLAAVWLIPPLLRRARGISDTRKWKRESVCVSGGVDYWKPFGW